MVAVLSGDHFQGTYVIEQKPTIIKGILAAPPKATPPQE